MPDNDEITLDDVIAITAEAVDESYTGDDWTPFSPSQDDPPPEPES